MDVSVVIPTHNREKKLVECLSSLFEQDYPFEKFEIIVVDDGSTDGTEQRVKELSLNHRNLGYLKQENKGPASARNLGASNSNADIVAFTDDDCVVERDWIRRIVEAHIKEKETVAIGGLTKARRDGMGAVAIQFLINDSITAYVDGRREVVYFPTCNVSYKRWIFEEEQFDETFSLPASEDLEFGWRVFKRGYGSAYDGNIRVHHNHRQTSLSHMRQAYQYSINNYRVKRMHPDHPGLKSIVIGNNFLFVTSIIIDLMDLIRFPLVCAIRLRKAERLNPSETINAYLFFVLHKVGCIMGTITGRRDYAQKDRDLYDLDHR